MEKVSGDKFTAFFRRFGYNQTAKLGFMTADKGGDSSYA
jgi:hypothetical protein